MIKKSWLILKNRIIVKFEFNNNNFYRNIKKWDIRYNFIYHNNNNNDDNSVRIKAAQHINTKKRRTGVIMGKLN